MRCWNCHKKIPKGAQVCEFCEAAVQADPTPEEMEVLRGILDQLPEDALNELHELMQQSGTAEEFVNRIFVGDCPKCGSSDTGIVRTTPRSTTLWSAAVTNAGICGARSAKRRSIRNRPSARAGTKRKTKEMDHDQRFQTLIQECSVSSTDTWVCLGWIV